MLSWLAVSQRHTATPPTVLSALCLSLFVLQSSPPQYAASPPLAPLAAGGSDDCATAQPIAGAGFFAFDNSAATTSTAGQAEPLCDWASSLAVENDVWFAWTANSTGAVTFATCSSTLVDTKLAVYAAASCPGPGTLLACNDDACALQSSLVFDASLGTTYLLQVGTFAGATGGTGEFFVGEPAGFPCGAADDGDSETSLGLTFGGEILALVYIDCLESLDAVEVAFGSPASPGGISLGSPVQVAVWDDPTNDADPTDAQLLHTFQVPQGVVNPDLDAFTSYDILAQLGSPLALFSGSFVGVAVAHNPSEWPLALDQSASHWGRNWIAGATAAGGLGLDLVNLAANNLPPQTLESIQFPGHWLLRAQGTPLVSEAGVGFCSCDGAQAPCSNPGGPGRGCANGAHAQGALLTSVGTADVLADTLVLHASGLVPLQPGLFFQGTNELGGGAGVAFGDGLRCAGGSLVRLEVRQIDATGQTATTLGLAAAGGLVAGDLRHYQFWFRDPFTSPCGTRFNLTGGYRVQW
ncbi:MAG: hypothetical protein ABGY71_08835 [bacterium]|nr:hypothetical protein [Planctomycetota bacterium]HIL53211.1 hypothetical protein [Planctomycetota bacterium]